MKTTTTHRSLGIRLVAALALAGAALALGCGSGEPAEQGSPRTIAVTPPAGGTRTMVEAGVGDVVVVSLEANPTTGYEWTFTAGDTFTIEKSKYMADPRPEEVAGGGGIQVVTLPVTRPGVSDLRGTYARSWESPEPGRAGPDATVTIDSSD